MEGSRRFRPADVAGLPREARVAVRIAVLANFVFILWLTFYLSLGPLFDPDLSPFTLHPPFAARSSLLSLFTLHSFLFMFHRVLFALHCSLLPFTFRFCSSKQQVASFSQSVLLFLVLSCSSRLCTIEKTLGPMTITTVTDVHVSLSFSLLNRTQT